MRVETPPGKVTAMVSVINEVESPPPLYKFLINAPGAICYIFISIRLLN